MAAINFTRARTEGKQAAAATKPRDASLSSPRRTRGYGLGRLLGLREDQRFYNHKFFPLSFPFSDPAFMPMKANHSPYCLYTLVPISSDMSSLYFYYLLLAAF